MHPHLLYNGTVHKTSERLLGPGQTGVMNGWGVFSTIRVKEGVLFAWERHFARMKRDAQLMRVPFFETPDELFEGLHRLIEANQAHEATLRVAVIRNKGGLFEGPDLQRDFDYVAFTADLNNWGRGVKLMLVPHGRHAASKFAGVKVTSWAQNLTWYEEAHHLGFDEVLFLNERGEVSECTSANIFAAFGDRVLTPPLESGCLPGVTRHVIVHQVHVPGVSIEEQTIMPEDLDKADEVFITSTTRDLLPVLAVDGLHLRQGSSRMREALSNAFGDFQDRYVAEVKKQAALTTSPR